MSSLLGFTDYLEHPRVPLRPSPPPETTSLREEPTEQRMPPPYTAQFKHIQWLNWQERPDFTPSGFQTVYVAERRAGVTAIDEQIPLLEYPKPPEQVYEIQYIQRERPYPEASQHRALKELERFYLFEDHSAVAAFIEQNRLRGLLEQAREPLDAAFGGGPLKKLTLVTDDEGFKTLLCLVLIPDDMQEARRALRSFDQRWWLGRSAQADGKVNFDFGLV